MQTDVLAHLFKSSLDLIAATDFLTIEVWTSSGLVTYYILFVIHLETRRIQITGVTTEPNSFYVMQVARKLTDEFDGSLIGYEYLIMDRDTKFTSTFRVFLEREGVEPVRCPPRTPTCNAIAERFVCSVKEECLERMILFGERSLRLALCEYEIHYLKERNHQGVGNRLLETSNVVDLHAGTIKRRERLGGMLSFYYREAA